MIRKLIGHFIMPLACQRCPVKLTTFAAGFEKNDLEIFSWILSKIKPSFFHNFLWNEKVKIFAQFAKSVIPRAFDYFIKVYS